MKDVFKGVGEGAVAQIVQQSGAQGHRPFAVVPQAVASILARVIALKMIAHPAGNFVDPQAVAKAGVLSPVENQGTGP